ncbi:MAG: hypothetical protein ACXAD7_08220 [Candidatus Kariarchaeaceae archaeon]|jgi:hypothetical protein
MDHVVYLDKKASELEKLLSNTKTMLIRGAAGRKMPYRRVSVNDILYLINNDGSGVIQAKATVKSVFNSEKMSKDESAELVNSNKSKLNLSSAQTKRWAGKRYLVLIEIEGVETINPFKIDRSEFSNMDDWLPVNNIELYKQTSL